MEYDDLGVYHCLPRFGEGDPTDIPRIELGSVRLIPAGGSVGLFDWYQEHEVNYTYFNNSTLIDFLI